MRGRFVSEYGMLKIIKNCTISLIIIALAGCTNGNSDDQIDLIVVGQTIVTMDANATIIENGAIAISDGVIVAIGKREEITGKYSARKMISGDNRVVLPGLVNGHSHAAMTLLRGIADGGCHRGMDLEGRRRGLAR